MTIPISTIVNVQISRQTTAVTQAGFGVPLIVGPNAANWGNDRVREYLNLDEVAKDFQVAHAEYKAANAIFSQNPKVEKLKIGRQLAEVAMIQKLTFNIDFVANNTINGKVAGIPIAPVPFNVSHNQTMTDLATVIEASFKVATAVVTGAREITVTAQTAGVPSTLSDFITTGGISQPVATITTTTPNHGIQEDLSEIREADDDWYGLIYTSRLKDKVELAAAYIEAQRKIFITASNDANILDSNSTTDIAAILNAANRERTAVIFNSTPDDFADAAWMGKLFPFDPGNETWKFKTLTGITADKLTSTQRTAAIDKNCNLYVEVGGVDITEEGTMAVGEFIDIIRGVDWLQARMEERIYSRLVNLPKVPYTDAGVTVIEAEIRAVLENGIREKLIADNPPYTVTAPKVADVDPNDRANRFLPDVHFEARLAGAIHKITVQGVVTV